MTVSISALTASSGVAKTSAGRLPPQRAAREQQRADDREQAVVSVDAAIALLGAHRPAAPAAAADAAAAALAARAGSDRVERPLE